MFIAVVTVFVAMKTVRQKSGSRPTVSVRPEGALHAAQISPTMT